MALSSSSAFDMDPQLRLFRRQFFQLLDPDFLAWPQRELVREIDAQSWLYHNLFDGDKVERLPPERYQLRVLKRLLNRIEHAIEDPQEHEISDELVSHLTSLLAMELPSELTAAQQKTYVTYTCLPPAQTIWTGHAVEPTITLLEHPHLISGSQTTGFRTWEAALHLGSYLLTPSGTSLVRDKKVLELGAGTGFLSILCAKHLGAQHVTATDGDEGVIEALKENLFLNGLDEDDKVLTSILRWGTGLIGTWVEEDCEARPYDVVLGADITYDKTGISALISSLRFLFQMSPALKVIISSAVRNKDTFEAFRQGCEGAGFVVEDVRFPAKTMREQRALFYATAVPLRIVRLTQPKMYG